MSPESAEHPRRLKAFAAEGRGPAPVVHPHPELYRLALAALTASARSSGAPGFMAIEAQRALAEAGLALAAPGAPAFGPQPDPRDALAFLKRMLADNVITASHYGYAITRNAGAL